MTLVGLVDDHSLFSTALAVALRTEGFDIVIPPLTTMEELCDELVAMHPQVAMIDRDLGPLGSGEDLIEPATRAGSSVIVVSASLNDVAMGRCLARGAVVCLPKSDPFTSLLSTVVSVAQGERPMPDAERYLLIDTWRRWQDADDAVTNTFALLTRREASVLGGLVDGRSVRAIANESYVSEATVRTQVRGILTKLGVSSQLQAVALALRAGWRPQPSNSALAGCPHGSTPAAEHRPTGVSG